MAGIMASVGTVVAATGGVAAVVGGVSSVAAAVSRSRSESYTRKQIQSIVERLNCLPDIIYAMLTISDLAPGEFGVENALVDRQTNLSVENLLDIRAKTNDLVIILSSMQTADENKDLNSMLKILKQASLLLKNVNDVIDREVVYRVATILETTSWLLQNYKGASEKYRNVLQLIEKFMIASPATINLLAKFGLLSTNWSNLVKIVSSSKGIRVAEKVAKEFLEKAGTKVSVKAGAEVAENVTEKVLEQTGTNVTGLAGRKVAGKVGGEVLEHASTKAVGKIGGKVLEQANTKVAGTVGGKVLEQASTKVAEKVGWEVLEQASTKVAGTVGGEVLEQASTKVAGTVGGEVLEQATTKIAGKVSEEVLEQGGNTVARKVGEEVAEKAANSSNVSGMVGTAANVKYIRMFCASVVIFGIVVDSITLKSALQNLYNGSPTDLSNFLSSLADILEPLVS